MVTRRSLWFSRSVDRASMIMRPGSLGFPAFLALKLDGSFWESTISHPLIHPPNEKTREFSSNSRVPVGDVGLELPVTLSNSPLLKPSKKSKKRAFFSCELSGVRMSCLSLGQNLPTGLPTVSLCLQFRRSYANLILCPYGYRSGSASGNHRNGLLRWEAASSGIGCFGPAEAMGQEAPESKAGGNRRSYHQQASRVLCCFGLVGLQPTSQ